jgi:hypothetical protein
MFRFGKTPSFDEQLRQLGTELAYFNQIIGAWPTRIKTSRELQEVTKRWNKTVNQTQSLLRKHPDSVDLQFIFADLLRMGHNIDIKGAAQSSGQLLQQIIQANPDHFQAHYCLARLYVSISPQTAPLAEKLFLKAEALASPKIIADIYQGLGFACMYQNKVPEAIAYFENISNCKMIRKFNSLLAK